MTRTVDDAALMMCVLSKPDRRDGMSLPPDNINWKALDKSPRKLRIGLMLDARRRPGAGAATCASVAVKAAKAFESAGAVVTEVDERPDARDARRARQFLARADVGRSLETCARASAARRCPISSNGRKPARRLSGVDVVRGFNATMAIRAAAAKLFCELDYVISPVSPVVNFPAEFAAPINDPDKPFEHIAYTVPWNMSENPADLDQWRLRRKRVSDRRPDRRPPLRRSRRARHGQGV